MIDQGGISAAGAKRDERVDVDGVIYERLLPALAASVGQLRHELAAVLSDYGVAAERRGDIARRLRSGQQRRCARLPRR
jgi:hypothetical protein